jgi:hypothetical protein
MLPAKVEVALALSALTFAPAIRPFTERLPYGLVVPIPTFPAPVTMKWVALDEPMANSGTPEPSAFGLTESWAQGVVVPMPKVPLSSAVISGESLEFVIWKLTPVPVPVPLIESFAYGVLEPTPTFAIAAAFGFGLFTTSCF